MGSVVVIGPHVLAGIAAEPANHPQGSTSQWGGEIVKATQEVAGAVHLGVPVHYAGPACPTHADTQCDGIAGAQGNTEGMPQVGGKFLGEERFPFDGFLIGDESGLAPVCPHGTIGGGDGSHEAHVGAAKCAGEATHLVHQHALVFMLPHATEHMQEWRGGVERQL